MKDSDFGEDVEVSETFGFLVVTVWVEMWRFGEILAAGILIPDVETTSMLETQERVWQVRETLTSIPDVTKSI